mmetsp:Transcript_16749/g.27785  ORF Transcript_16749/g.27785 Transcript_16749/m.27785 type:complete len:248 (+) Transcript_16749:575-1318(+)
MRQTRRRGVLFVLWINVGFVLGLNGNFITIPKSVTGNLESLIGTSEGLLSTSLSLQRQLSLAEFGEGKRSAGGFSQQERKTQSSLGLCQTGLPMLDSFAIIFTVRRVHENLRWSSVFRLLILRKKQLGQADLLFSSTHLCHGASGGSRKQVCLECCEVLVLATTASLNAILQVNQETEIGNSAVIVSIAIEDLKTSSRQGRSLQDLCRAKLFTWWWRRRRKLRLVELTSLSLLNTRVRSCFLSHDER